MSVCILTSVSDNTPWAAVTLPNRVEYCLRHGYSLHVECRPYGWCVGNGHALVLNLLGSHELVWAMDADVLITDMRRRIEDVPGLGPHVTVCEEQIIQDNPINGGSVVWRNTEAAVSFARHSQESVAEWGALRFGWQTWVGGRVADLADVLTVLPSRAFNSVEWSWGGGGCHWQPGDFVYHPCGIEHHMRASRLRELLPEVVQ